MNARDELAKLLFIVDNVGAPDPEHEWEILTRHSPTHTEYVYTMADALITAGYQKPRQVTTEEELDDLPPGSVVLSLSYLGQPSGQRISFQRWADGDWHRGARSGSTHPDNFLPATVLHEPEADK
ncbi:hypothetical protein PP640_gp46 [Arthrobacter phage Faja]|uniref:Uncharacterized protein n=1 Tax=Arthrobacter phage Faja TaxID=2419957 RepID=A0A3G2KG14_9CAUD|nr:hypothetical protein PP640_gp46 [Arthrobacter phage Faja]AYN57898.1 hypothetical protein PBI_FAJA_46 [Arthrobacter phage Faja]